MMLFAQEFSWFTEAAKQGTTFVILAAFAFAVWKWSVWFRDNAAVPLVSSHLQLVMQLRETLKDHGDQLHAQTDSLKKIEQASAEQSQQLGRLVRLSEAAVKDIKDIESAKAKTLAEADERRERGK